MGIGLGSSLMGMLVTLGEYSVWCRLVCMYALVLLGRHFTST